MGEALRRYSLDKKFKKEMIDGKIYLMARPRSEHIEVQFNLAMIFNNYFKQKGKKCVARIEDELVVDINNFFSPDVQVLCKDSNDGKIPVIVIEILSASTIKLDRIIKMKKYAELGIKEYWIITWQTSAAEVYLLNDENNKYELYDLYTLFDEDEPEKTDVFDSFSSALFPELIIKLSDVFSLSNI
jgi:Uma2 family endonuclease